ncbi:helix-turn-helix domain-containing protein [Enterococcus sp. DIV0187]|uniref:helix-turn-helix domain-containing protein n=1 Tax=Enterococcus sp. DIV0187 TaxID=2774644 RepID=UPI003F284964
MTIGDNIKKVRKLRGMTQFDLAAATGLSRSYLGDLENSRRNPSTETIKKLSKKLGVSLLFLMTGNPTATDTLVITDKKENPIKFSEMVSNSSIDTTFEKLSNITPTNTSRVDFKALGDLLDILNYLENGNNDIAKEFLENITEILYLFSSIATYTDSLDFEGKISSFEDSFKEADYSLKETIDLLPKIEKQAENLNDTLWQLRDDYLQK